MIGKQRKMLKKGHDTPLFWIFSTRYRRNRDGLVLLQFNFTVGVRGSISNLDRTEPLSFLSTFKTLDITSRVNLEKIRKVTAKRAFEAHDLLLHSYYAVKSRSSSSQVDF
jgi:hypothetical protein